MAGSLVLPIHATLIFIGSFHHGGLFSGGENYVDGEVDLRTIVVAADSGDNFGVHLPGFLRGNAGQQASKWHGDLAKMLPGFLRSARPGPGYGDSVFVDAVEAGLPQGRAQRSRRSEEHTSEL